MDFAPKLVRCYAELTASGEWQALSLEFGLAAQADTYPLARKKLEAMIQSYATEACGIHKEHARELLTRKAPLFAYARYYLIKIQFRLHLMAKDVARVFDERPSQELARC